MNHILFYINSTASEIRFTWCNHSSAWSGAQHGRFLPFENLRVRQAHPTSKYPEEDRGAHEPALRGPQGLELVETVELATKLCRIGFNG